MSEPRVSGAEIRVAITGASPLVNPRLSEINWDDVARVLNAQREEVAARTPSQPDPTHRKWYRYDEEAGGGTYCCDAHWDSPYQPDLREARPRYDAYVDGRACHNCGLEPYRHECPIAQPAPAEYPGFAADVLRFVPRFTDDEHGMDPDAARRIRAYLETRVLQPAPADAEGKGLRSRGIQAFPTGEGQRAIDRATGAYGQPAPADPEAAE